jgi:hypothetical protein
MSPDLESFIEELQAHRDPRGAEFQATLDRWVASTETALRLVDETANFDADHTERLDEIRAIVRQKERPVMERLFAFQHVMDALQILAENKARHARQQLEKLRR